MATSRANLYFIYSNAYNDEGEVMKRIISKIILFIGTLPFVIAIISGIYAAATKFSGISVNYNYTSPIKSFCDWIILYSYVFWATYIIGAILIIISVIMLLKTK